MSEREREREREGRREEMRIEREGGGGMEGGRVGGREREGDSKCFEIYIYIHVHEVYGTCVNTV